MTYSCHVIKIKTTLISSLCCVVHAFRRKMRKRDKSTAGTKYKVLMFVVGRLKPAVFYFELRTAIRCMYEVELTRWSSPRYSFFPVQHCLYSRTIQLCKFLQLLIVQIRNSINAT